MTCEQLQERIYFENKKRGGRFIILILTWCIILSLLQSVSSRFILICILDFSSISKVLQFGSLSSLWALKNGVVRTTRNRASFDNKIMPWDPLEWTLLLDKDGALRAPLLFEIRLIFRCSFEKKIGEFI